MSDLTLKVHFPKNLITKTLLEQARIPCLSRIGRDFEILFQSPLPEAGGLVEGWTFEAIDSRVPAGVGGQYRHYAFSTVTLAPLGDDAYSIVQLAFFNRAVGWCPIIENGDYVPAGGPWSDGG
jgi:hypothetical protein